MLLNHHTALEQEQRITIEKTLNGRDVSLLGAFAFGEEITFSVKLPRRLGASAVVMRIAADGEETADLPFLFGGYQGSEDTYLLTLSTRDLCKDRGDGLFYYELLFLRGFDTLF